MDVHILIALLVVLSAIILNWFGETPFKLAVVMLWIRPRNGVILFADTMFMVTSQERKSIKKIFFICITFYNSIVIHFIIRLTWTLVT